MRIEHLACWTRDLERFKRFYTLYFGATAGSGYVNAAKGFESRFLTFSGGTRLEAMTSTTLPLSASRPGAQGLGLTHLAIAVGSENDVDRLTQRLRNDGVTIIDGPRRTGDGYYEAVVLDPDGTRVELCATRHDLE